MLMGYKEIGRLIWVIFHVLLLLPFFVQGQNSYDRDSLDSFIHDIGVQRMGRTRSGILYNVSLPANFSGMEAAIVRLRSASLWIKGANYSSFYIPPRVLPWPFTRRINIVYENLGNWSSDYYNVANHTFIAPVIGLLAYDANNSRRNYGMVALNPMKDPILVHFPQASPVPADGTNVRVKCVRFDANGTVEFTNMTQTNSCVARGTGHFSLVIPSPPTPSNKKKQRLWKWWEIGFAVGIVGLILLIGFGVILYKCIRTKRMARMERQSDRSEALDSIWVGQSRMPSATGIRTLPAIENSYVP